MLPPPLLSLVALTIRCRLAEVSTSAMDLATALDSYDVIETEEEEIQR